MKFIKGFASHDLMADNSSVVVGNNTGKYDVKGAVNVIGELSQHCLTFRKDVQIVNSPTADQTFLHIFTSVDDTEAIITITNSDRANIFNVINHIYDYSRQVKSEIFPDVLSDRLLAAYGTKSKDFTFGPIVTDGTYWMPEWVAFEVIDTKCVTKIWFSDDAFRWQYDDFDISVLLPIENVDDFFERRNIVEQELAKNTAEVATAKIADAANDRPYTRSVGSTFLWHNKENFDDTIPVAWWVLIYGEAGDNIDSIKDALKEYILANSEHTEEEWKVIFPDIFKRTEFTVIPQWDKHAVEELEIQSGIYSPIVDYRTVLSRAMKWLKYPQAWVSQHLQIVSHHYRSLQLAVSSGEENVAGKQHINEIYPDYINANTASTDYNRQFPETREWAELLSTAIIRAESMNMSSGVNVGRSRLYTRLVRDGNLYIVFTHKNVNYLILAKYNFDKKP